MVELPSGTVTMLFSDVEGSTRLVRALGSAWAGVLEQQRVICRRAWADHGGHELATEGDSFFVVFATAGEAVSAAVAAQRGLAAADWPDGPVALRMGIHAGSPQRHADGYVGMDVHRAARVASVASGGQILVSEATERLAHDDVDPGIGFVDLGLHQLKDIPNRMRLLQVTGNGLRSDFPALRTSGAAGALPVTLTPTVGRSSELADIGSLLLGDSRARLVTLTGPGGSGKSRLATTLAAEVADEFAAGVFFVPMASVTSPAGMWAAMAMVLDVPADGQAPPVFLDHLGQRRLLLVLDNLEQIAHADVVVRELLDTARQVQVVVTSRKPLHVEGEFEYAVPPLTLPPIAAAGTVSVEAATSSGAVQMFVEHARRVRKGFQLTADNAADVARLCVAIDGLPLAIELAAARMKLYSPAAILGRIDQSLDLASADRSRGRRQRTIRGAIQWSYDLLTADQQTVLDRLGVFEGGAPSEAVEAVVGGGALSMALDDVLFDLVDTSLLSVSDTDSGEPRFVLLETVKRFAVDRLRSTGVAQNAHAAHAQYFYDLARTIRHKRLRHEFARSRGTFVQESGNFRALVDRRAPGVHHRDIYGEREVPPLHVAALLAREASANSRYSDALLWADTALQWYDPTDPDRRGLAALLAVQASTAFETGRFELCLRSGRRVLELCHERAGSAVAVPSWVDWHSSQFHTVAVLAELHAEVGNHREADAFVEQAIELSNAGGSPEEQVAAQQAAYSVAYMQRDFDGARRHLSAAGTRGRGRLHATSNWLNNMADLDLRQGRYVDAWSRLRGAAESIIRQGNPKWTVSAAETFGAVIGWRHPLLCARVYGSAATTRVVEGIPNLEYGIAEDERVLSQVRPLVTSAEWEAAFDSGRGESIVDLLREMAALPVPDDLSDAGHSDSGVTQSPRGIHPASLGG